MASATELEQQGLVKRADAANGGSTPMVDGTSWFPTNEVRGLSG